MQSKLEFSDYRQSKIIQAAGRFGGKGPPGPPLNPPGGGGTYDGMDGWQTSVENRLSQIAVDLRGVNTQVGTLNTSSATMLERVSHLPTKSFIVTTVIAGLTLVGLLITFQSQIQAFLKVSH